MKRRTRIIYSESQRALMFERWRKGDSMQTIAQLFARNHSSVHNVLSATCQTASGASYANFC